MLESKILHQEECVCIRQIQSDSNWIESVFDILEKHFLLLPQCLKESLSGR